MCSLKIMALSFAVMLAGLVTTSVEAQDMLQQPPEQEITGTVADATTGAALGGVEITLERGAADAAMPSQAEGQPQTEEVDSFETDDAGEFTAEKPDNGTYTLKIEHEGYETWTKTIRVTANGIMADNNQPVEELEINLQPSV